MRLTRVRGVPRAGVQTTSAPLPEGMVEEDKGRAPDPAGHSPPKSPDVGCGSPLGSVSRSSCRVCKFVQDVP